MPRRDHIEQRRDCGEYFWVALLDKKLSGSPLNLWEVKWPRVGCIFSEGSLFLGETRRLICF